MRCAACDHLNRTDIDRALGSRDTIKTVAERFGLSTSAIGRHRKKCLGLGRHPVAPSEGERKQLQLTASDTSIDPATITRAWLVQKHASILSRLDNLCQRVEENGNDRLALDALKVLSGQLKELSKSAGIAAPATTIIAHVSAPASAAAVLKQLDLSDATPETRQFLSNKLFDAQAIEGQSQ